MIPYNPYLFVAITIVLVIVPIVQAGMPGVEIPPAALLAVAALNVACAALLKMMAPGHDYQSGALTDDQTQRAPQPLSAEQIAQAVAAVKAEMTRDPEGDG